VFLRFSRYRFREGQEAEGLEILKRQAASMRTAPGCEDVWLAQGQHPSTEFVLIGRFRDERDLHSYEGRLRSNPAQGGDFFSLLRLTTQPPEVTQYETREPP
jgi:quinol monooxygenase YgiN